jgi:hypothetical protein
MDMCKKNKKMTMFCGYVQTVRIFSLIYLNV